MKKFFNPIEFFNDRKLLIANLIIFVAGTLLSIIMHATFESPIDLHFSETMVLAQTVFGNTISTLSLFLSILLAGKIINKKTRIIDCLNLALYLRIPYYLFTLINITQFIGEESAKINDENNQIFELIFAYVMILFLFVFLVIPGTVTYRSFRTITNAKKTTDYLILITAMLVFIIISSLIIRNV